MSSAPDLTRGYSAWWAGGFCQKQDTTLRKPVAGGDTACTELLPQARPGPAWRVPFTIHPLHPSGEVEMPSSWGKAAVWELVRRHTLTITVLGKSRTPSSDGTGTRESAHSLPSCSKH